MFFLGGGGGWWLHCLVCRAPNLLTVKATPYSFEETQSAGFKSFKTRRSPLQTPLGPSLPDALMTFLRSPRDRIHVEPEKELATCTRHSAFFICAENANTTSGSMLLRIPLLTSCTEARTYSTNPVQPSYISSRAEEDAERRRGSGEGGLGGMQIWLWGLAVTCCGLW